MPRGLACDHLAFDGEQYVVLSFPATGEEAGDGPGHWDLSVAERGVAAAAAAGKTNQEIARLRRTSTRTVANQLASIYRKLGINSRAELAAWWHGTIGLRK